MSAVIRKCTLWLLAAVTGALLVPILASEAAAAPPPVDCNVAMCVTGVVGGNVNVGAGQTLRITDAQIGGNVTATDAREVVICDSTIDGSLRILRTVEVVIVGGPGCGPNTIGTLFLLEDNRGGTTATGNTVGGNLVARHNSSPVDFSGNAVAGSTTIVPIGFNPLTPARVLDTRPGELPGDGFDEKIPPGTTFDVQMLGRGGVPASGVKAIVLNLTITEPNQNGHATLWPSGTPQPSTSNINYGFNQTVANEVIMQPGANGKISVFVFAAAHVIIDVQGWIPTDADYRPLNPARIVDTRTGGVPLGPQSTVLLSVLGRGGLPSEGIGAIVINVTSTGASQDSHFTVWPDGQPQPPVSNLNFAAGQTAANIVLVAPGSNGRIRVFNNSGEAHLIIDVLGWMPSGTDFNPVMPARIVDTRLGFAPDDGNDTPLAPGETRSYLVLGRGGLPTTGVGSVVIHVTITSPTSAGHLTVWPSGTAQPATSNLNWGAGQTVANGVIVQVGEDGKISVSNSHGETHVIIDLQGWYPPA